jgi:phage I-like protein
MEQEITLFLEVSTIPDWILVLPMGTVELVDGRDPFVVDDKAITALVAGFQKRGVDLVIDYEHQTLQGDRAPAAGWIKFLEKRQDGLWAKVEWTAQAQEYLRLKEYRYLSPVLRLNPETRQPTALLHVALTNVPAIQGLPPLVAKQISNQTESASGSGTLQEYVDVLEKQNEPSLAQQAQEVRSRRYGIGIKAGSQMVKPVAGETLPDEEWGDPVNYRYPCNSYAAAQAAWQEWQQQDEQCQYSQEEQNKITVRLKRLSKGQGFLSLPEETDQEIVTPVAPQKIGGRGDFQIGETWYGGKLPELFRDLALTLNLPEDATVSHLKEAVAALQGISKRFQELQEELAALRETVAEENIQRSVDEALQQGKISPSQKNWALLYCRQDPTGFQEYVSQSQPLVPVGIPLNLVETQAGTEPLNQVELEVCKHLNISPGQYRAAKVQVGG